MEALNRKSFSLGVEGAAGIGWVVILLAAIAYGLVHVVAVGLGIEIVVYLVGAGLLLRKFRGKGRTGDPSK
jgi:hypothetical protein